MAGFKVSHTAFNTPVRGFNVLTDMCILEVSVQEYMLLNIRAFHCRWSLCISTVSSLRRGIIKIAGVFSSTVVLYYHDRIMVDSEKMIEG